MDYRLFIARRYLISRRQFSLISIITGISIAGISLGVAALIVVLSVMNGFYDVVRDLLVSFDPHIRIVSSETRGIQHADSLMAAAAGVPHVVSSTPYVEGKALFAHEGLSDANKVVIVRGVDPATLAGVSRVAERITFGDFDLENRGGKPGIIIGASVGTRVGLFPKSDLRAASDVALLSAAGIERMLTSALGPPPLLSFEVRGLYELESVYDETHVFIPLPEAQRLFRMGDRVSGVELRLDDLDYAADVKAELERRLPADRYRVLSWYDLQRSLYDVMRLEKWGASIILALIIVVAAFNIVGSLTMVVIEKRRDLGVLQAMGVSRRNVRRIFLLEGLLIGCIGSGIGLAAGLGLALLQQRFKLVPLASAESFIIDAYPVSIQLTDLVLILGMAIALCVLAALYPSVRASSVEPARAVQDA